MKFWADEVSVFQWGSRYPESMSAASRLRVRDV